jgi:hypothetical protein
VRPQYDRTRVVDLSVVDGQLIAVCSCNLFIKCRHCCRHIYKLIGRKPKGSDNHIRWWKLYLSRFKRDNEETTETLIRLRDNNQLGVPVESALFDGWAIGQGEASFESFEKCRAQVLVRGPSYWISGNEESVVAASVARTTNHGHQQGVMPAPYVNLTQDVDLSQAAQKDNAASLSQASQAGNLAFALDSDEGCSDREDSDSGTLIQNNPYTTFLPLFGQLTNAVRTKKQEQFLKKLMHDGHLKLMSMLPEQNTAAANVLPGSMGTMPNVDRRRVDNRKKPACSPEKSRKKKRPNPGK